MKRFLSSLQILILMSWLSPVSLVFAQSPQLEDAQAEIAKSIKELTEKVLEMEQVEEFELRKEALGKVLSFTKLEIEELEIKLAVFKQIRGSEFLDIYSTLTDHLANANQKVVDFKFQLNSTEELETIKSLALELKEWRESDYNPKNETLFDFLILARSQELIKTASKRSDKVNKDLARFEERFGEIGLLRLQIMLGEARLEIGQARVEQSDAAQELRTRLMDIVFDEELILEAVESEPELVIEEVVVETPKILNEELILEEGPAAAEAKADKEADGLIEETPVIEEVPEIIEEGPVSIGVIIEGALSHVKGAYEILFEMSRLASQLLQK